jgi:hypothetical protein
MLRGLNDRHLNLRYNSQQGLASCQSQKSFSKFILMIQVLLLNEIEQ